jgi:Icc-related predicted phosphoesterase
MATAKHTVRLAAVSDIHCSRTSQGALQPLFAQITERADALLLCGDLTDYGLPEEAHILVKELTAAKIPVVAVLGNHDYQSEKQDEVRQIVCDAGVTVLDGDTCEVAGIGFAGVKGFGGGFGRWALSAWGEKIIKRFVREAVDEALKLENALSRLQTAQNVVLLHYAPIQATVEGEPPEVFPFLGSSRLEEPLDRYPVTVAFHGHTHHGSPEGRTSGGVPIYNVSVPVLQQAFPDRPPFRIVEIPVEIPEHPERAGAVPALG